jgi:hypothetical protein
MAGLSTLVEAVSDVLDVGGSVDVVTGRIASELSQVIAGPGLEELFAGKQKSYTAFVGRGPSRTCGVGASTCPPGPMSSIRVRCEAPRAADSCRGRGRSLPT